MISSINPIGGGPIEGIKQFYSSLSENGNKIEILSLDDENHDHVKQSEITVHAMGPGLGSYEFNFKFNTWLSAHCHEYDVFIINGIWQYHSFAAHRVLTRHNIPYYIFTHGMLDPWFKHQYPLKHLKKCLYWRWGEYPVLRDAKRVLFTCEDEMLLARLSFNPCKWNEQVINYGTTGHVGDKIIQRQLFLSCFPHLQDKRVLLFLSRIHPKKGVDILIESFAQTCQSDVDLHLVIAGPDQTGWQNELIRLSKKLGIDDRITWTGMLSGDMKWGAYLAAKAFILPSHQENFGIVVAEALSCGMPVLISNKINIWREIERYGGGFVDNDDTEGTVRNIKRFQTQTSVEYAHMSEAARSCFSECFTSKKATETLLQVFADDLG